MDEASARAAKSAALGYRAFWFGSAALDILLLAAAATMALVPALPRMLAGFGDVGMGVLFVLLFAALLRTCLAIVSHAGYLATRIGEPTGTLLTTICVNVVEVATIAAVVTHGANNPTLLRDSLLSSIILTLNGFVGLALIVGGWRHREQHFNLQGANSYLSVLVPMAVLTLILPSFVDSESGAAVSGRQIVFLALMCSALYCVFVLFQTGRYRDYFVSEARVAVHGRSHRHLSPRGHAVLLAVNLASVILLALQIAVPIDHFGEELGTPPALTGLVVAVLVALPEAVGAIRAAHENRLQAAINSLLGSSLATIGITVPAMLLIGAWSGRSIELGLHGTNLVMLELTLLTSVITFVSGRTSMLQGAVHLLLFGTYLLLAFQV